MFIPKKYLTEKILIESKLIMADDIFKLLLQDKNAEVGMAATSDPNFSYYKKLASDAASGRVQGKHGAKSRIDLNKIKLSKRTEVLSLGLIDHFDSLSNALNALQTLMESKGHYDPNNEASNIIQITTLEILAAVLNLKPPVPPKSDREDPEDPDDKKYPEGKIDWTAYKAEQLAKAHQNGKTTSEVLDDFYEFYYRKEYAGLKSAKDSNAEGLAIVEKLKSLNKILIPEFNSLGYNPEVNPFAQFLKNLIEHKKETIFDKLTFNTYGAIHNAFIDKKITGNMLGVWDVDSENNILFCDDLYKHNGVDIVKYLGLQNSLRAKAKSDSRFPDPAVLAVKVLIYQNEVGNTFEEKVKALLESSKLIKPIDSKAKLRSELEISELYTYLFKDKLSGAEKTDEEKEQEEVIRTIISLAKRKQILLDMLNLVIEQSSFKQEATTFKDQLTKMSYTPNKTHMETSAEILREVSSDGYTLTSKDLFKLATGLLNTYNRITKKAKTT